MKLKTKYNIGDVVRYYNYTSSTNEIGIITHIYTDFSWETLQKTRYTIEKVKISNEPCSFHKTVDEYDIKQRLNKKAFEKAFAEECAREVAKGEEK